jgi:hypothetical protein
MKLALPRAPLFGRDTQGAPSEVGVFVPADAVFPSTPSTEEALIDILASLNRDDTLFQCARTNTLVSGPGDFDVKGRQQKALYTLCTPDQIDRINDFARGHRGAGAPTVFFRGQMLELMRWAARYSRDSPTDGTTFIDRENRSRFVEAALIAGVLWSQRVYGSRLSGGDEIETLRRRAVGPFRKGVEEGNLAPHLGVTLGRGWSLFNDYFPRWYPDFAKEFQEATGLTLEQYLTCTTGLATYTIFNKAEGPLFVTQTVAAATAYREILPTYFALEAQTSARLATALWDDFDRKGYRPLRDRPIMVLEDGRGMILDPTFYSERISIGPLFHLVAGAAARRGKDNQIFGAFGNAFESYAIDILRRMYPSRAGLVDRLACSVIGRDASGREFEIDVSLNDVTEAVIFEIKGVFLPESAILDEPEEKFLDILRAKYGASPGERDKGVAQLARSIGAIARGEWLGLKGEFRDVKRLYPVLVAHDVRMGAPGLGHFLAEEFTRLLGTIPAGTQVAPLTVMTIDDLENMESSVGAFSMVNLLADYTRSCPDRIRSLHNCIVYSDYGPKILPSADLIRSSTELIERVQKQFFPPKTDVSMPID